MTQTALPTALPTALRDLLIEVRNGLRARGDDGVQGGHRARVPVKMGWTEVRAVYALHIALSKARADRDDWKKRAMHSERAADPTAPNPLTQNRAVLDVLIDVERVLSGEEDSEAALHATLQRVRDLLSGRRRGRGLGR